MKSGRSKSEKHKDKDKEKLKLRSDEIASSSSSFALTQKLHSKNERVKKIKHTDNLPPAHLSDPQPQKFQTESRIRKRNPNRKLNPGEKTSEKSASLSHLTQVKVKKHDKPKPKPTPTPIERKEEQLQFSTAEDSQFQRTFLVKTRRKWSRKSHSYSSFQFPPNPQTSSESIDNGDLNEDDENIEEIQLVSELELTTERVETAIRNGRVFEIRGFVNRAVREILIERGWVEKRQEKPVRKTASLDDTTKTESVSEKAGNFSVTRSKSELMNSLEFARKMLNYANANFIWTDYNNKIDWTKILEWQIVNKHPQTCFVRKCKLAEILQNLHWFAGERILDISISSSFPRTYRLYNDEEKDGFFQDFKLTACTSLLKWFIHVFEKGGKEGLIPSSAYSTSSKNEANSKSSVGIFLLLDFALAQLQNYIRFRKHDDIDDDDFDDADVEKGREKTEKEKSKSKNKDGDSKSLVLKIDWPIFLTLVYETICGASLFSPPEGTPETALKIAKEKYFEAREILQAAEAFWPQSYIDGMRNVWIFKPGNGNGGKGIVVLNSFAEIAEKYLNPDMKNTLWLVQKYIEKPYLVRGTKFDIRQWFMISSFNPLTAWFYKESYLRFSSKPFTMEDLDRQIHLTNRGVQEKYEIDPSRDPTLPLDNMWTSSTFQTYLEIVGHPTVWTDFIYPEMKRAILSTLLAIQESLNQRERSFVILGADFLLSQDFRPWLIEINSSPRLNNSSSVTSKLCPLCIQDAIKVILDCKIKGDLTADTGDFELLYRAKEPLKLSRESENANLKDLVIQGQNSSLLFLPKDNLSLPPPLPQKSKL